MRGNIGRPAATKVRPNSNRFHELLSRGGLQSPNHLRTQLEVYVENEQLTAKPSISKNIVYDLANGRPLRAEQVEAFQSLYNAWLRKRFSDQRGEPFPLDYLLNTDVKNFSEWLAEFSDKPIGPYARRIYDEYFTCGDAILLVAAHSARGFDPARIEVTESRLADPAWLIPAHHPKLDSHDGPNFPKVSPINICLPLSDDPRLRIEYKPCAYYHVSAAQKLLARDVDEWNRCAPYARLLDATQGPGVIPRNLCMHIVVLQCGESDRLPRIVLCQRSTARGQVTYFGGRWSASIEEQYRLPYPGEERWDKDLVACVVRGIEEELIGEGRSQEIFDIRLHAIFIEAPYLNLCMLASARLRTPLEELRKRSAQDRAEIPRAVAVDATSANLDTLLCSKTPPMEIIEAGNALWDRDRLRTATNEWHPTSPMRLALARWLIGATDTETS